MKTEVIILILWGITFCLIVIAISYDIIHMPELKIIAILSTFAVVIETFDDMRKSYKKRTYTNKKVK